MNSNEIGKIGELIGIIELMKKGYNVYRPIDDSGVDYIILKDSVYNRIQIRTSKLLINKNCYQFHFTTEELNKWDLFVCVCLSDNNTLGCIYIIPKENLDVMSTVSIHKVTDKTKESKWDKFLFT